MKKLLVVSALLVLSLAPLRGEAADDPKVRLALTPMLGLVGGMMPGAGIDMSMGYGMAAWGIRLAHGEEFCLMCDSGDPGSETQIGFLAGVREELAYGSISLKSGIVLLDRDTPDISANKYYETGIRNYKGVGLPFQLDLMLSARYIGLSFSATVIADGDGGSASLMAGIPVGLLRW